MFHLKRNVGPTQRVLRIVAGCLMVAGGVMLFHDQAVGYVFATVGAMGLLTGVAGYCPACAMIGVNAPQTH